MVSTLKANRFFDTGLGYQLGESNTAMILQQYALGKPWSKDLQNSLQSQFGSEATQSNPLGGLVPDIPGALMFVAVIFVGITFIILGGIIVLRKK
jgi:hypothetical protein